MPRRSGVPHRDVLPDPKFGSKVVAKLTNQVMQDGKKGTAQSIVYEAFDIIKEKLGADPMDVFAKAMENVMPVLETKARRVGGATYQVPIEVDPERQVALAMRWITTYSRSRKGKSMTESLAGELLDAFDNTGSSIKKKEDTFKMAQANKAFAHYRW